MSFTGSPIFIGGSMKSGTSLLRTLISSHENIFGGLETHWFSENFRANWQDQESKRQIWMRQFFDVSAAQQEALIARSNNSHDFFNNFMNFCTIQAGKSRWVEKTPANISHVETILKYWPNAKIINCVRDCRDVYASWKRVGKESLPFFIDYMNNLTEALGEKIHIKSPSYSFVLYEELVQNKHVQLEGLFSFLNENYSKEIGDYQGDETVYDKVLKVTGKVSTTGESLSKPINDAGVQQYKDILTQEEIKVIERELYTYLSKFSYLN
ncbi:sulfotransferase [Akkermansiaceae bacterium]|nr:sulfotransferase [Akkermansiaceae bacterium]